MQFIEAQYALPLRRDRGDHRCVGVRRVELRRSAGGDEHRVVHRHAVVVFRKAPVRTHLVLPAVEAGDAGSAVPLRRLVVFGKLPAG